MKIIDFARKGNVVRFFLGDDDCEDYWGDDWDDVSYENNAGEVYERYVKGVRDISFPFDDLVLEPYNGCRESNYCKDDMKKRIVPCIIVLPKALAEDSWYTDFNHWVGADGIKKYYFGDKMELQ